MSEVEYPVQWTRSAEKDLESVLKFVAEDRLLSAALLAARLEEAVGHLSLNPRMGRVPRDKDLARKDFRHLVVGGYLIFYKFTREVVFIHRIIHGARDYPGLL